MVETWAGNIIKSIAGTGFFDYFIPFMLTFAVLEGVLQRTNFFTKKKWNHIFSAIISMMMMPMLADVNMLTYISKLVIVLVGILCVSLIMGVMGLKVTDESKDKKYALWIGFTLFLIIIILTFVDINSINISSGIIYAAILIAVMFGIVAFITGGKQTVSTTTKQASAAPTQQPRHSSPERQASPEEEREFMNRLNEDIKTIRKLPPEEQEKTLNAISSRNPQLADYIRQNL